MPDDLWAFERLAKQSGFSLIAGIDEAGRGPLAGPVVSAAVVLPKGFESEGVIDSKQVPPLKRVVLYERIYREAVCVGIGIVDAPAIDRLNILRAALLSMSIAVSNLAPSPDYLLIDGTFKIPCACEQMPVPGGDALSVSIASASIVAKVTRDRLMERYHFEYPEYGFHQHKGYATREHRCAIQRFGCCPIHRKSFRCVSQRMLPNVG